ncbi:Morn repeat incomplete domain containing protein [Pandoravirus salinus]|uniref:Morn repeat incomplete domain containing protein n=1 Tax=Pandoravirus salinus TaxID=1349410 RepID=S4VZU1_9VIRU|nr:morn repeat incomplete domain [Pandoravirus salinus]AGO83577.2 Morn repeat incomplete domain containing protein [Pandoravirus salinus]
MQTDAATEWIDTPPHGVSPGTDRPRIDVLVAAVDQQEDAIKSETDGRCDGGADASADDIVVIDDDDDDDGDDDQDISDSDDDCSLFPETQDDGVDEAREAACRRAYVAACGPGVPVFLAGARARADKDWAWLLAAASKEPTRGKPSVGRADYGPYRFYVGDVDARGLPDGYGAMVHMRPPAFAPRENATNPTQCRWPAPWALLKWHEGFWRGGQREGDGINVCLEYKVAMEGRWRRDLFDGHGARTYGRGRWTLLADGSGRGRWSDGDIWCHRGQWKDGERYGPGVLTIASHARPYSGIWMNGFVAGSGRAPNRPGPSSRP